MSAAQQSPGRGRAGARSQTTQCSTNASKRPMHRRAAAQVWLWCAHTAPCQGHCYSGIQRMREGPLRLNTQPRLSYLQAPHPKGSLLRGVFWHLERQRGQLLQDCASPLHLAALERQERRFLIERAQRCTVGIKRIVVVVREGLRGRARTDILNKSSSRLLKEQSSAIRALCNHASREALCHCIR